VAILFNTLTATYDILDNSGIRLGASTASYIHNIGLFEKKGGTATSRIAPAVTNAGTIKVSAGTLDLQGAVTGKGTDEISGASTMQFDAEVAFGQTVDFTGAGGELALSDPAAFAGHISGFDTVGTNDTIEVAGPWVFSGFTENAGGTQGSLHFVNGASTLHLTLIGEYNRLDFVHQTQANGGTLITYTGVPALGSLLAFAEGARRSWSVGEFGVREASGSAHSHWGAAGSWIGSVGHGPGPS
jgi:hypothetical protein